MECVGQPIAYETPRVQLVLHTTLLTVIRWTGDSTEMLALHTPPGAQNAKSVRLVFNKEQAMFLTSKLLHFWSQVQTPLVTHPDFLQDRYVEDRRDELILIVPFLQR